MSDTAKNNSPVRLGHFFGSFGVGVAVAALALCGMATLMAGHGLSRSLAWPLATAAVCLGSAFGGWLCAFLQKRRGLLCGAGEGAAFAVFLLLAQGAAGTTPDEKQFWGLALIALAGMAGGLLCVFFPVKHR